MGAAERLVQAPVTVNGQTWTVTEKRGTAGDARWLVEDPSAVRFRFALAWDGIKLVSCGLHETQARINEARAAVSAFIERRDATDAT